LDFGKTVAQQATELWFGELACFHCENEFGKTYDVDHTQHRVPRSIAIRLLRTTIPHLHNGDECRCD
jgi:hypothetical protein